MIQHSHYRIKFRLKSYQFSARYSFTLLTILMLSLFITLGCWQLARWKEKKVLQESYQARLNAPPVSFDALPKHGDIRFYLVQIEGKYDNAHIIFLDNKIYQHRVGYDVITPFILSSGATILVNRGWVPALQSRKILPHIPESMQHQSLTGMIYVPPGKPFMLGRPVERAVQWPLRMQNLDIPILEKILGKSLYPYLVLLVDKDPHPEQGFVRDWQPVNMPAYKHLGYAVQWFIFGLVLIIIFMFLNIKKTR